MISEGGKLIEDAKRNYLFKAGKTFANPATSRKTYWSLINTVLNKAKIPIIPPLLENGSFITDFSEKAHIFNEYFILQCTTIDTGSELPQDAPPLTSLISDFPISDEKILNIIRSLNPNKAHGWDEIYVRMIKLSDAALVIPRRIIFKNCLRRGLFPEIWKYANVVPVHKKNEKNVKGNYRPISLLPIFGKILEKLMYDPSYSHFVTNELLNPNQSGFHPGDSTVTSFHFIFIYLGKVAPSVHENCFSGGRGTNVTSLRFDSSLKGGKRWCLFNIKFKSIPKLRSTKRYLAFAHC